MPLAAGYLRDSGFDGSMHVAMSADGQTIAACRAAPLGAPGAFGGASDFLRRGGTPGAPLVMNIPSGNLGWPDDGLTSGLDCGNISITDDGSRMFWGQRGPTPGWYSSATLLPSQVVNTPPVAKITGVVDGQSVEFGTPVAPRCAIADAEDGNRDFSATVTGPLGPRAASGLGSMTATCSFTDSGGLSVVTRASYAIVDTTGPSIGPVANITVEAAGASGAPASFAIPTANDAVDGPRPVGCTPVSGS
ncbi:MAG: hypothetical protein M3137_11540, partial [Actinomycetota bacterium]|nr:hypothetical protein [Actinomycetota bacterium]